MYGCQQPGERKQQILLITLEYSKLLTRECPSSKEWDRCLVLLRECFAHHFHITRRVVDSANGVSRWSFV